MKAYNQKIIETPTYTEIYEYEAIITPKQKAEKIESDSERRQELEWIYENNEQLDKRKEFDELSAQGPVSYTHLRSANTVWIL